MNKGTKAVLIYFGLLASLVGYICLFIIFGPEVLGITAVIILVVMMLIVMPMCIYCDYETDYKNRYHT